MTSLRGWGRIIMVASVTGPVVAIPRRIGYATAKAGMVGLTRAAAVDTARHGNHRQCRRPRTRIATGSQTPEERGQGRGHPSWPERLTTTRSPPQLPGWPAPASCCPPRAMHLVVDGGNSIAEQRAAPA